MGGICFFSIAARKQVHFDRITGSSKNIFDPTHSDYLDDIAAAIVTHNSQQIITASADGKINIIKNVLKPGVVKSITSNSLSY